MSVSKFYFNNMRVAFVPFFILKLKNKQNCFVEIDYLFCYSCGLSIETINKLTDENFFI